MFNLSAVNSAALNTIGTGAISASASVHARASLAPLALRYARSAGAITPAASATNTLVYARAIAAGITRGRAQPWNSAGATTVHTIKPVAASGACRGRARVRGVHTATMAKASGAALASCAATAIRAAKPLDCAAPCSATLAGAARTNVRFVGATAQARADVRGETILRYAGNSFYTHFAFVWATGSAGVSSRAKRRNLAVPDVAATASVLAAGTYRPRRQAAAQARAVVAASARERVKGVSAQTQSIGVVSAAARRWKMPRAHCGPEALAHATPWGLFHRHGQAAAQALLTPTPTRKTRATGYVGAQSLWEARATRVVRSSATVQGAVAIQPILRANIHLQAPPERTLLVQSAPRRFVLAPEPRKLYIRG